jgi:hypothetical protein
MGLARPMGAHHPHAIPVRIIPKGRISGDFQLYVRPWQCLRNTVVNVSKLNPLGLLKLYQQLTVTEILDVVDPHKINGHAQTVKLTLTNDLIASALAPQNNQLTNSHTAIPRSLQNVINGQELHAPEGNSLLRSALDGSAVNPVWKILGIINRDVSVRKVACESFHNLVFL